MKKLIFVITLFLFAVNLNAQVTVECISCEWCDKCTDCQSDTTTYYQFFDGLKVTVQGQPAPYYFSNQSTMSIDTISGDIYMNDYNTTATWNESVMNISRDSFYSLVENCFCSSGGGSGSIIPIITGDDRSAFWDENQSTNWNLTPATDAYRTGLTGYKVANPLREVDIEGTMSLNHGVQNVFIEGGNPANTGIINIAIGKGAMENSTNASANIAIGQNSLQNAVGSGNNIGIGRLTLRDNISTTGGSMSIGNFSLFKNTTGFRNTAIGVSTLINNITGHSNVAIGYEAGKSSLPNDSYGIYIGSSTFPWQDRMTIIGCIPSVTGLGVQSTLFYHESDAIQYEDFGTGGNANPYTYNSGFGADGLMTEVLPGTIPSYKMDGEREAKTNIRNLEFNDSGKIYELQAVKYDKKIPIKSTPYHIYKGGRIEHNVFSKERQEYKNKAEKWKIDSIGVEPTFKYEDAERKLEIEYKDKPEIGFIAEEVIKVYPNAVNELGLTYYEFIAPTVSEVQKHEKKIIELEKQVEILKTPNISFTGTTEGDNCYVLAENEVLEVNAANAKTYTISRGTCVGRTNINNDGFKIEGGIILSTKDLKQYGEYYFPTSENFEIKVLGNFTMTKNDDGQFMVFQIAY